MSPAISRVRFPPGMDGATSRRHAGVMIAVGTADALTLLEKVCA